MSYIDHWCSKLSKVVSVTYSMYRSDKMQIWKACSLFDEANFSNQHIFMVLNSPITLCFQASFLLNLWKNAVLRITVDGGTNSWLSWLKLNNCDNLKYIAPDLVTGDMDSLSEDVLNYFSARNPNVKVIKTPNQNETDFTKAIREVKKYCAAHNIKYDTILVLADSSGRLDQIIGNLQTLFLAKDIIPDVKILLLAADSMSWLLSEGIHRIEIPTRLRLLQEWCALIPVGSSCRVTTSGLKWNLNNSELEFGKLVSTSNTYELDCPTVTVETDRPLIWSMGIEGLL